MFGLVPEFMGKGFGGAFLTRATETAWKLMSHGSGLTKRVWVQTSSGDHPHALPNYERRGFRVFRVERGLRAGLIPAIVPSLTAMARLRRGRGKAHD